MTPSSENENVLFDRLVDGELSADERERLLSSLDDSSDGWRRCALAFLEAQSWRRELKHFVSSPLEKSALTPVTTAAPRLRSASLMALAAGLLLAFAAGWWVRSPDSGVGDVNNQLVETRIERNVSPEDVEKVDPDDVVTLLVRDDHGKPQRLRVPLVDSAGLDNRLGTMLTSLPAGFRDNLQERGLDLRGRRRYAPLYFEQNDQLVPMVVPVDDAYLVPVSRQIH
jgi:hypothetical protein